MSVICIRYRSVSDDHITVDDEIRLFVHLEDLPVHVRFIVVHNLRVAISIGAPYIDWFITCMLLREPMIDPVHYCPVTILLPYPPTVKAIKNVEIAVHNWQLSDPSSTAFQVVKEVLIPPNIEVMVSVPWSQAGFHYYSPHPNVLDAGLRFLHPERSLPCFTSRFTY